MSPFELALRSLHAETLRTDGEAVSVNFRHNGTDWIVWLGDGTPETSRQWFGIGGENAMLAAWQDATHATEREWWKRDKHVPT